MRHTKTPTKIEPPPIQQSPDESVLSLIAFCFVPSSSLPWVLVPDGSFRGALDWLPPSYRVGPWSRLAYFYVAALCVAVTHLKPTELFPDSYDAKLRLSPPEAGSFKWYCQVTIFLMMCFIQWQVMHYPLSNFIPNVPLFERPAPLVCMSYTACAWMLTSALHFSAVLAPFSALANKVHRALQLPALSAATITFVVFNLVFTPLLCLSFGSKFQHLKATLQTFMCSHQMLQLHFFVLLYAAVDVLLGPNKRTFEFTTECDLWWGLVFNTGYALFYLFVMDRLGLGFCHLLFTPRSPFCVVTWTLFFTLFFGTFWFWNKVINWK